MNTRIFLAVFVLLATPFSYPQQAQPAPPPPPHPGQTKGMDRDMRFGHGMHRHDMFGPGNPILPFGMWWKNPEVVSRIGLTADQQKHIEDVFLQSRLQLIHLHADLEEQQLLLEPLLDANPVDQTKALAQIDKIADSRADLEKANARMLLSIRGVLSADQWTKLQAPPDGTRPMGRSWGDQGSKGKQ